MAAVFILVVPFPSFSSNESSRLIAIELTYAKQPMLSKVSVSAERDPIPYALCYHLKLPIACYRQLGMKRKAPTRQPEMPDQRKQNTLKRPVYTSFRSREEKISLRCGAYMVSAYREREKRKDQRSKSVYSLN